MGRYTQALFEKLCKENRSVAETGKILAGIIMCDDVDDDGFVISLATGV